MINKDTQLFISISERPSNFGTNLHNAGYGALNLNCIYKAIGISDLSGAIRGVRALGIRGCSVSMPFKIAVTSFLDELDDSAVVTGAVNTITNDGCRLKGYNTDLLASKLALIALKAQPSEKVLILGCGGVARAILVALRELGFTSVSIASRNIRKASTLNEIMPFTEVSWDKREHQSVELLINATPIGMSPASNLMPVNSDFVNSVRAVMDVVVAPFETRLISCARDAGKMVAPGYLMSLEQAISQFKLYTGLDAPRLEMEKRLLELIIEGN
jgi:shikimate dehydrogenase